MALVPTGDDYFEQESQTTSHQRGVTASAQARRRQKMESADKDRQVELLRLQVEKRQKQLDEARAAINLLYEEKERDEEAIAGLKEQKLLYRVFRQLDVERKESITMDNVVASVRELTGEEQHILQTALFDAIPVTHLLTIRAKEFNEDEFAHALAEVMGVDERAIEVALPDGQRHGLVKAQVRLNWHFTPTELLDNPVLPEEEREEITKAREEYFAAMGGSEAGVPPEAGHAKEVMMVDAFPEVLESIGCEVVKSGEETRAGFHDFKDTFWFKVEEARIPASLRLMMQQAKQVEEDTILPEEALDRIIEYEHLLKQQEKKNFELARDTQLCNRDIMAIDKQIAGVSKELLNIQRITGYDPELVTKVDVTDFEYQEGQIAELTMLLRRLEEEKKNAQQILRKKGMVIDELTKKLDEKKEVEEDFYQCVNDVRVVEKQIDELQNEMKKLKIEHSKSDRCIVALEGQRDLVAVQSLQGDKSFLQQQIANHVASRREQDRAIKAQGFRLSQLETRLSMINNALKDLKMDQMIQHKLKDALVMVGLGDDHDPANVETIVPQNEMIDVKLYELLNRDLDAITNSTKLKDIIILEKEASIEATELKVEALASSKEVEERYYDDQYFENRDKVEQLRMYKESCLEGQRRDHERIKRSIQRARKEATQRAVQLKSGP